MKLSEIHLNPKNPRIKKDSAFEKLCNSIKEFPKMMSLRPIIIDDTGMILGGNMRYQALKNLGYNQVPDEWIKKASELTEDEKQRFIIADNVSNGEWDIDSLLEQWDPETLESWGLELELPEPSDEKIKTVNIKAFQKTHILFSFSPELFIEIQDYIQKIKDTEGVEYEQSSN